MVVSLHFEEAFPSIFEVAVNAFKTKAKDISNSVLMSLIVTIKNQSKEIEQLLFDIESSPEIVLGMDLESFYENMDYLQDNLEKMLRLSEKHKNKSDIFMEYHKAIDRLYNVTIVLTNEIGFTEAQINHTDNIDHAS